MVPLCFSSVGLYEFEGYGGSFEMCGASNPEFEGYGGSFE